MQQQQQQQQQHNKNDNNFRTRFRSSHKPLNNQYSNRAGLRRRRQEELNMAMEWILMLNTTLTLARIKISIISSKMNTECPMESKGPQDPSQAAEPGSLLRHPCRIDP
jgi:hypothetical protein